MDPASSHTGTVCIHSAAGLLATNGQWTANRMRSMPSSIHALETAGVELIDDNAGRNPQGKPLPQ